MVYEVPSGPGVRTDGFGYAGYRISTAFDSLLAKVIAFSPSADFGQFRLAVAADYTATMPATVTSSAGDATLTVQDPSAIAPGHLVNGTYVMAQALQVKATNAANPATAFAPVETLVSSASRTA